MPDLFEDSWKRLKRSKVHADAFRGELERLFPKDGCSIRLDKESEGTWIASAVFNSVLEDDVLSLELGEFFYQLRAALDALIWKVVWITEGSEPPADANRLEFPICSKPKYFNDAAIHSFKFPEKLKEWIAGVQPYSPEKPPDDPDIGLSLTLQTIHDCARKDRHRRLHIIAAVAEEALIDGTGKLPPGVAFSFVEQIDPDFLKGKNAFLRFGLVSESGALPTFKGYLTTGLKVGVSVDEIPKWEGSFLQELFWFGRATEHVIIHFEDFFAGANQ